MYILALDLSSTVLGVAEGDVRDEKPILSTEVFFREGQTRQETFGRCLEWIAIRLKNFPPDRVVIEAPIEGGAKFHRSPDAAYKLLGVTAVVGGMVWCRRIQYREARVNTVRAHFIGHGGLPGDQAKKLVFQRCQQLGWDPKNNDEADAAAVWHWACAQVRKPAQMDMRLARTL